MAPSNPFVVKTQAWRNAGFGAEFVIMILSLEVERLFIEWFFCEDYCFSKGL